MHVQNLVICIGFENSRKKDCKVEKVIVNINDSVIVRLTSTLIPIDKIQIG